MENFIKAKEILDSKGMPTVEVELTTDNGKFIASIPSGVSTGNYEAVELRDQDGRGVKTVIENIENIIAPVLAKECIDDQKRIDGILLDLDGTNNKSKLGANAILSVSIAVCRAIAVSKNIPLWKYISELSGKIPGLPKPSFNIIEGGKHSDSGLSFQEFMIIPQKDFFKENLEIGIKIYQKLGEILKEKVGEVNISLSKESAFSAPIKEVSQVLDVILQAAEIVGHRDDIKLAIDAASSSFFENDLYKIDGKDLNSEELINFYKDLVEKYPIISIEDPFFEEDFENFSKLKSLLGNNVIIIGDDLLATNIKRIKVAKEKDSCGGIILKPNQIGTVSEAIEAGKLAQLFDWKVMVSNRAGETEDYFIADLAVGIGADFIKSGAPFAKERMAKYNRLLVIENNLK